MSDPDDSSMVVNLGLKRQGAKKMVGNHHFIYVQYIQNLRLMVEHARTAWGKFSHFLDTSNITTTALLFSSPSAGHFPRRNFLHPMDANLWGLPMRLAF